MDMRALNSFRTVSQLYRGNETVSAVRGASSGPAGQLTALAARGAARRASVLAMLLLVGHCVESSWRIGWTVVESGESDGRVASMALRLSDAQHHAFIPGQPQKRLCLVSQRLQSSTLCARILQEPGVYTSTFDLSEASPKESSEEISFASVLRTLV